MGLMDWGKAQFLDILEWLDDSNDTLAWRWLGMSEADLATL